jgi:PAS domain S-box-containing protein
MTECNHPRKETSPQLAGEALRQRDERHQAILQAAMDGYWMADIQGRLLEVNTAYCRMSGYSEQELLAMGIADVEAVETRADIARHIQQIMTQGEVRFESRHRRKDGSVFDVEASVQYWPAGEGRMVAFLRDITERKRTVELLKSQFERSPDIILIIDRQYKIEVINRTTKTGFTVESLKGQNAIEMLPPQHQPLSRQTIDRCFNSGQIQEFEHSLSDGRWVRARIVPMAEDGVTSRVMILSTDITERKRAVEALRQSENRLREIIDNSQAGYFFIDRAGLFQRVNGAWLRMHGYESTDEVIGQHFSLTQTGPDMQAAQRTVERLIAGEHVPSGEFSRRCRDGAVGYHTFSAQPVIRSGEIVGLEGFLIDATSRKQAEQELLKLAAVVRHSGELINLATLDGQMTFINEAGAKMLGIDMEAVDQVHIMQVIPDPLKARVETELLPAILNGGMWQGELQYRHLKTGQLTDVHVMAFAVADPVTGAPLLLANVSRDITASKRAEAEKIQLQAQLQQAQKLESVGRLAGGVAHDFNNMLNVILGYAELAQSKLGPSDPLRADLQEIITAAERSAKVTRQLLAFARKQTVAPKVLHLNETVAGMHRMLERLIGEQIQIEWRPGVELWPVTADPSQIDQILANLCVNARDAIAGVGKITIATGNCFFDSNHCATHPGYLPGAYVWLSVSDNGCGMDPDTLAHIFEPFFTTKGVGEGTGLGLAMVYGAVQQNNGFIIAESEPGQGSCFTIYLPKHDSETIHSATEAAPATLGGHETILLVEDEAAVLALTKRILENQGYTVLAANAPKEAIRVAEAFTEEIHLLMSDVIMPGMNGWELSQELLSLYPGLKRLFISGYPANVIANLGVLDADVNFIQKPFLKKDLTAKVREVLDRK